MNLHLTLDTHKESSWSVVDGKLVLRTLAIRIAILLFFRWDIHFLITRNWVLSTQRAYFNKQLFILGR